LFTNCAISGYASLRESFGENTNIRVVANSPYGQSVTQSGEGGLYMFTGLGNGTYSLNFQKEGYGDVKMYNIQLFGNDTARVGQVSLFKKYNFPMPILSNVRVETNPRYGGPDHPAVVIETTLPPTNPLPGPLPVVLYIDTMKSVSYKSYVLVYPYLSAANSDRGGGTIDFIFNPGSVFPFKKGTIVYFQAYVANPEEYRSGYFDSYLGVQQLSTLIPERHSEVMSFIMP
jgi:hypothetical protein